MSYWEKTFLVGSGAAATVVGVALLDAGNFSLAVAAVFVGSAMAALGLFQGVQVAIRRAANDVAPAAEAAGEQ